jgi:hypothetical protein
MCGVAYRMVTDMGCHLAVNSRVWSATGASNELSSDIENEWRRRLYWGAFVTDATQCLYLGRQMTLRANEGRVPQLFLDTYEELEEWCPYVDHRLFPAQNTLLLGYQSRPAYAISTFTSLIRLAQTSSKITQAFYSFECINNSHEVVMKSKAAIEDELLRWQRELPTHLHFAPETDAVPPPHQITPQ